MRWSGTSSTHLRRSVPGYNCRPMSAKMDKTKTDRIATSRSRRTASNKAPTIVFKPTHRRHRRRHGYSPEHSTRTHTRLTALCPGLPWAGARKVKPIWILLKQETASGSDISWAICKSAPRSRQITTQEPHHSVFYRLNALPAAQPTASKH